MKQKVDLIIKHAMWLIEHKGEHIGTREIRKHLLAYIKGIPKAKQYRSQLVHVKNLTDIKNSLTIICNELH